VIGEDPPIEENNHLQQNTIHLLAPFPCNLARRDRVGPPLVRGEIMSEVDPKVVSPGRGLLTFPRARVSGPS